MKFALFHCCVNAMGLDQYFSSTSSVLKRLGIEALNLREFNCCGYPLRNFSFKAFVLASARNLAIAEKQSLDILTVCNCCYGNLKYISHILKEDTALGEESTQPSLKKGCTARVKPRPSISWRFSMMTLASRNFGRDSKGLFGT